jgi:hypothetical protein
LISYSLYLVHWPVLVWARDLGGTMDLPLTLAWACVVLSVGLAWLSWRFVERPFRLRRGAPVLSRRQVFWGCGAGAGALAAVAGVVMVLDGVPQRLPSEAQRVYKEATRFGTVYKTCKKGVPVGEVSCVLGAKERAPDVVIWGDSHVLALTPGLQIWAEAQGLTVAVYNRGGCAPVSAVYRTDNETGETCARHNAAVLSALTSKPVPLVVLLGRWPVWADGSWIMGYEGYAPLRLAPLDPSAAPQGGGLRDLFEYGLDQTLAALRPHAERIVILGGVPKCRRIFPVCSPNTAFRAGRCPSHRLWRRIRRGMPTPPLFCSGWRRSMRRSWSTPRR